MPPPKKKARVAQEGETAAGRRVERELEEGESHNEAPAPAPPVPPPAAPGQQTAEAIQLLTQLVAALVQRQDVDLGDRAVSARARDFITLKPPEFYGSKPEEDPQDFIDQMWRTLRIMHASDTESVELASYRLRDVAALWYNSWIISRGANAPPPVWQEFTGAFLRHFLPPEVRRARADMFLNLKQGNMSAREYSLRFNSLARYAPAMVADMGDHVHRFVSGLGPHLIKECLTASLQDGMTIARIQAHAQNLEEQQQSQRSECDSDRGCSKKARSSGTGSKYKGGQRQQYSRQGQSSRVSGSPSGGAPRQKKSSIPRCSQCRKFHPGLCRHGSNACYACGQIGHKMRECLLTGGSGKDQPAGSRAGSFSSVRPPKQTSRAPADRDWERGGAPSSADPSHRIYALTGWQDPELSPDAATGT